ncbi:hypothetical protein Pcinc_004351 [Petrolisthes cinctipes]|uniref:BTB domain-containing protein n=1 Tax=Petrolisthes cinctipes TaxID=88211 RepID=A0AAE1L1K8_PETCI|nr:hypothetical protein Pcinc_004351 [Petrolisthes cinctipes]
MSEEVLDLSWNNHVSEFCHMLSSLQTVEKYTDVTVVCEDKFYPCHKLILSTYSSYFTQIFESTSCRHPVVVLRDVASSDWTALLTYMYKGKVSVARSHLPCLIQVANHLKIKGFALSEDHLKSSEPSENQLKNMGFVLSENSVAGTRKRSGQADDWASQQHKRPRKVKQDKHLDTTAHLPHKVEEGEELVRKDESDTVGEGDLSTAPHVIVSRMRNSLTTHQHHIPLLQEEIFVETTVEDPDEEEDETGSIHIDLSTESHLEQELHEHKINMSLEDEQQCDGRRLYHPAFIKKEMPTNINSHQLDFQEAELLHREKMQVVASQMAECNKSIVLSEEKYKAILALLHNPSERVCPRFRHWVKNRRFRIMDLPDMELTGVLAIPEKESFYCDDTKPRYLRVVPAYQAYDIVYDIHNHRLNHAGYKRVLEYLHRHYYGITRNFVQLYCKTCPTCATQTS